MSLLKIEKVSKKYNHNVLCDVSLNLEKGETVCLLGKSGSGKTTLLNCIMGIEKVDSGKIVVTESIAYMQQKDLLLPHLTILDNVLLPQKLQHQAEKFKQEALDLLATFDLERVSHAYPPHLSGGMRQRVAFLRTILAKKQLMLLDEPFGALDAITRLQLQQWYRQLVQQFTLTTLLVTHDIDEALYLSDRIVVLKQGQLSTVKQLPVDKTEYLTSTTYLQDKAELLNELV